MSILQNNKYKNVLFYWLCSLIFLLISMILIGGLTRLTDSGLSITNWDLFSGIIPPLNNSEWSNFFYLYQKIPQFYQLNPTMTLDEFKIIYFWEYVHRLLGRIIGLAFLLPLFYFIYKKILTREYEIKFIIIFILIASQGFLGWYMVKSGLINNTTVSHYRLSAHLITAFIIMSSLVWILLNFLSATNKPFFKNNSKIKFLKSFLFLLYIQIIIGAFVSGLDAGQIYQTWPLMNDSFFPDDIPYNNFIDIINFNNQSFVQFIHRNLAYLIFVFYLYIGHVIFKFKDLKLKKNYLILLIIIFLQIFLGILTLITNLSLVVASLHQISSIFLIIVSLSLYHRSID